MRSGPISFSYWAMTCFTASWNGFLSVMTFTFTPLALIFSRFSRQPSRYSRAGSFLLLAGLADGLLNVRREAVEALLVHQQNAGVSECSSSE